MSIRLMIVDDHRLFREGIKKILSDTKDIVVVGEASDGESAIMNMDIYNPDIILLDIVMPHMNGIETLSKIKDLGIKSKVIILSAYSNKKNIIESIKIGANGFITKDNDSESLINVIRNVYSGETYLQPSLGKILRENIGEEFPNDIDIEKIETLSKREYEILTLIANGYNNKAIGKELFISEKTVKNHITSIFKKIEVEDRVQAVIFAYTNEII
ncbi:MAG: response regulator transcription factor [Tissierella sp.]|nr:response regulator transcription factor [Tissierella sp.]